MKKILSLFTYIILLFFLSFPCYAKDKEIEVDLSEKTLSGYTFTIEYESEQAIQAVLVSPNQGTYEFENTGIGKLQCTVTKPTMGIWKVRITNDTMDEEGNQVYNEEDVCDVKITVSAAKEKQTSIIHDNIKIGRDITGLNIYFKDDDLIVEWTDDSCGNVNVRVTNLDNAVILASETIKDKKFVCHLENTVRNISVAVVPTSSSNIPGAEQIYNFDFNNTPDADVEFPNLTITTNDKFIVQITTREEYSVLVLNNNNTVVDKKLGKPGYYEVEIPLNTDGINDILLYLVDVSGNMRSYTHSIVKDTVAPILTMSKEYDGINVTNSDIEITGSVTGQSQLTLNDEWVTVATDGYFSYPVVLHEGVNSFNIKAIDLAGNETVYYFSINQSKPAFEFKMEYIGIIVVVIFLPIYLIAEKVYKKKKSTKEVKDKEIEEIDDDIDDDEPIEDSNKKEKKRLKKINLNKNNEKILISNIWELLPLFMYVIAAIYIFFFVIQLSIISSGSMEPTLPVHDLAVYNRMAYKTRTPERGDIVTFYSKESKMYVSKRIIGKGGDTISFHDGYVYLNNEKLDEPYILDEDIETNSTGVFEVPKGYYFMLGDNRENSLDSRFWNSPYISEKDIKSKYMFSIPFHVFFN